MEKDCPMKFKVSARIFVYEEGKDPERDEPDRVIQLEDRFIDAKDMLRIGKWE